MLLAGALHLTAGGIAGGIFPIQLLLLLIGVTLLECGAAVLIYGVVVGGAALQLPLAVQIGYLVGVFLRSLIEAQVSNATRRGCHSRRRRR